MKPAAGKRYYDDEALIYHLRTDRSRSAWKIAYTYYQPAVYAYFDQQGYPAAEVKPVLIKAFAELLEDLRHGPMPLSVTFLDLLLLYCKKAINTELAEKSTNLPSAYNYLAKKVLVEGILNQHQDNVSQAIDHCFKEPALKIIMLSYKLESSKFDDAFQEAILALMDKPPQDKEGPEAKLFTYFMRILRFKVLDSLNRRGKDFSAGDLQDFDKLINQFSQEEGHKTEDYWDYLNEVHALGEKSSANNSAEFIEHLLKKIPPNCRTLLELRFIEEKKFKEISELLNFSIDSIGQRIKRCLKHMRTAI